uniref:Uncharacterized protein n=1 Tax=Spironucleus salmonicida TaxID=348837 RepID=V6LD10_9EUKA|eukprot:EST42342.1 Hypothetical protein SS50377_18131 [Spironucleus salmonicida]
MEQVISLEYSHISHRCSCVLVGKISAIFQSIPRMLRSISSLILVSILLMQLPILQSFSAEGLLLIGVNLTEETRQNQSFFNYTKREDYTKVLTNSIKSE